MGHHQGTPHQSQCCRADLMMNFPINSQMGKGLGKTGGWRVFLGKQGGTGPSGRAGETEAEWWPRGPLCLSAQEAVRKAIYPITPILVFPDNLANDGMLDCRTWG